MKLLSQENTSMKTTWLEKNRFPGEMDPLKNCITIRLNTSFYKLVLTEGAVYVRKFIFHYVVNKKKDTANCYERLSLLTSKGVGERLEGK